MSEMIRVSWEEVAAITLYGEAVKQNGGVPPVWEKVPEKDKEEARHLVRVLRKVFLDERAAT